MDPITLMAIGAALGIGKNELFDKPQAAKIRNYQAAVAKFSPWTHMNTGAPTVAPSDFDTGLQGGVTGLAIGAQLPKGVGPAATAAPDPRGALGASAPSTGMLTDGPSSTGSATGDYLGGQMSTDQYLGGAQPSPMTPSYDGPMDPRSAGFSRMRRMQQPNGYPGFMPGQSPWMTQG